MFLETQQNNVLIFTKKELSILSWFVIHEGLLFKRGDTLNPGFKLCIPQSQVRDLVLAMHNDSGHFGKSKTFQNIKEKFYWRNMQPQIRKIVSACDLCQKTKCSPVLKGPMHSVVVQKPGDLVCTDLIGPLPVSRGGASFILVFVDAFSRFVKLYAIKRATTKTIIRRLVDHYIPNVQKPACILSDNGTQYTSKAWTTTLTNLGIKCKFISLYFPEGNLTERYNKEVGRLIRAYCYDKHTKWATMLDFVEDCLNNSISEPTGYTPLYLQFGKKVEHPISKYVSYPEGGNDAPIEQVWILARERMLSKAEKRANKFNSTIKPVQFAVGDQVLIRTHRQSSLLDRTIRKFFLLYEGPFVISRVAGPNSYEIHDLEGRFHSKQNIVNLKGYKSPLNDQ
nr:unnamed protein product [Callosobruchus analis]